MLKGCFTALITPMTSDGRVDVAGLDKLVDFQIAQGVTGLLVVGTTGESPTLSWSEHNHVIERVCSLVKDRAYTIAGTGSNNTEEALRGSEHARDAGADAVLLVDPYYNGPSSLEIAREYIAPVARAFPQLEVIPYIIPGRSGTQLLPQDLGVLNAEFTNINAVKEATGDLENMAATRTACGDAFAILSGDDGLALTMMADAAIGCTGVVSVMSNIAPRAMQSMIDAHLAGNVEEAARIRKNLAPLFSMCGVTTTEDTPFGSRAVKARNPLPLKTLMNVLGMPSGPCRRPLGKMTQDGARVVLDRARETHRNDPTLFAPIADTFGVDIEARLEDSAILRNLFY